MRNNIFLFLFTLLAFTACDPNGNENPCENDFDQSAMYTNMSSNLIIPAFTDLKEKVDIMSTATTTFTTTPNQTNLEALRTAFFNAYLSWQSAAQYNFGPAEDVFLRSSVNNFPLNVDETNENIQSGTYDFDMPDNFDKGFPALDYLLHGIGADDAAILEKFTTATDASNYIQYLTDVTADIKSRVDATYNGWTADGFEATFISNVGTAAGSSLSQIVNNFNENYELIKREKIGLPSGTLTLGFTEPTRVEAYFSGRSLELATAALNAVEQFYLGGSGQGLDDFLNYINAEKSDGESLDATIKSQFSTAKTDLAALSGKLSDEVENNNDAVVKAYNSISAQLVNIKTDLPSVLCVSITYIDNPSDSD